MRKRKKSLNRIDAMHMDEKMRVIYSGICDIVQLLETNNDAKTVGE